MPTWAGASAARPDARPLAVQLDARKVLFSPAQVQFRPTLLLVPRRIPKPRRTFARGDEVAKAAGVSGVTLREWTRRGILPVPIEAVRGRGNVMKYPRSAMPRAELARRLRDEGWTLDAIAEYMQARTWDDATTTDKAEPTEE